MVRATHDVGGASRQERRQQRVQLAQLIAASHRVQQVVAHHQEASPALAVRGDVVQLQMTRMMIVNGLAMLNIASRVQVTYIALMKFAGRNFAGDYGATEA